jgi:hypothetical protein
MNNLSLCQPRAECSKKRAAAELARGQSPEEYGRPNKWRSATERTSNLWSSTLRPDGGLIPHDRLPPMFQSSLGKNSPPLANPDVEEFTSTSAPTSPSFNTSGNNESAILLQPETRPITQEQLVNEVKGIYAGLVMVERKCVEVYLSDPPIFRTAH